MNEELYKDIKENIRSFQPIARDYWWIKFSNYKGNILLFAGSILTGEIVTQHFNDEDDAVMYVNWLFHQNPALQINPRLPRKGLTRKEK